MRAPLALAALALLAGCVSEPVPDVDARTNATRPDVDVAPEPVQVTVGEGGVAAPPSVYTLAPKRLELKEDVRYELMLRNAGRLAHDLVIEGLDVAIGNVAPGQTSEPVLVLPQEKGTYAMYCTLGGDGPTSHRNQGMRGEVVVT